MIMSAFLCRSVGRRQSVNLFCTIADLSPSSFGRGSCRSICTKTLTEISSSRGRNNIPWLMLCSSTKPETRYLYEFTQYHDDDDDDDSDQTKSHHPVAFTRDVHLPQIADHTLIGSSQGFLLSVDPTSADIHATDPFTGSHLSQIPPTSALPHIAGTIRSTSNGRIVRYVHSKSNTNCYNFSPQPHIYHHLKDNSTISPCLVHLFNEDECSSIGMQYMHYDYFQKAILSPYLDYIVVIHMEKKRPHLAFARIGGQIESSSSWIDLQSPNPDNTETFYDMIFHNGLLHALDEDARLYIFDLQGSSTSDYNDQVLLPRFVSPLGPLISKHDSLKMFLVVSPDGNDLFCVLGEFDEDNVPEGGDCRGDGFDVFKLDKSNYKWNQVKSIGDLALFVGLNHSFALSAPYDSLIKPNCIYFTDCFQAYSDCDKGVYDIGNDTIWSLTYNSPYDGLYKWPSAVWFMPAAATSSPH